MSNADPRLISNSPATMQARRSGWFDRRIGVFERHRGGGGGGGGGGSSSLGGVLRGTTAAATFDPARMTLTAGGQLQLTGSATGLQISPTAGVSAGVDFYDATTLQWQAQKRSDSHFVLKDVVNTKTIMDVVPGGPVSLAYEPRTNAAAISFHQGTTWDANQGQSSLRTQINHSAGFSNGYLGRLNGDQISDDRVAGTSGAFSLRIGHGTIVTAGSAFNDRGSLIGNYHDITIDEVCRTINITSTTNTSPVVVTWPGAAGAPEWIPPGGSEGLATGDTVLVAGNSISALNGYWKVTRLTATTFQLDGSTVPGSTTSGSGTIQKLVYGETDSIFANVRTKRRGSYSWAAELNNRMDVVGRGGGVLIDVTPTLSYTAWNNPAMLGSTSEWLHTGNRGLHIALRDSGSHAQGGTGLFITGGNSGNWRRGIVYNNGATPNAIGTDLFCVDGTNGRIGTGAGVTSNQTVSVPARLTLGSDTAGVDPTASTDGIQFGTVSGVVNLYRSAANTLTLGDDMVITGNLSVSGTVTGGSSTSGGVFLEQAPDPTAVVNTAIVFARDSGGRTQLCVRMPGTGSIQVLATE